MSRINGKPIPLVIAVPNRISQWECRKFCQRKFGDGDVRWKHIKSTPIMPALFTFNDTKDAVDFATSFMYSVLEDTLSQIH